MRKIKAAEKIKILRLFRKRWVYKIKRKITLAKRKREGKREKRISHSKSYLSWNFELKEQYQPIVKRYGCACINAPKFCSVEKSSREFNEFFSALKDWGKLEPEKFNKKYKIPLGVGAALDMTDVEEITPAFALCLVAHMSEIKRKRVSNFGTSFVHKWRKDINTILKDMGFFELLGIKDEEYVGEETYSIIRYEQVRATKHHYPPKIQKLIERLKALTGKDYQKVIPDGLGEAMNNVVAHAYVKGKEGYFWYNAFYKATEKTVWIILYDLGRGIPSSMRSSDKWKSRLAGLSKESDKRLLEEACRYGITSTDETGRGRGMEIIMGIINGIQSSEKSLRIFSGKAYMEYTGKEPNAKPLDFSFDGTLIEWKYKIQDGA